MKRALFSAIAVLTLATSAFAQIPGLKPPKIDLGLDNIFKKGPAITTQIKDAKWEDASKDGFNPATQPLEQLKRGPNGGFLLEAGAWKGDIQSYCLHAGTHGPSKGDGYVYAPPKGPYDKLVSMVVRNSVNFPEVPQPDIQKLLWAMIARTKFNDMPREMQSLASKLLDKKGIETLRGGAVEILTQELMERGLVKEPPLIRQAYEAENNIRKLFSVPNFTFADMERLAVLTGDNVPWGLGSREVPGGRWSQHPDGFWVRYEPKYYGHTVMTIYVPEKAGCIGKEMDPSTQIATPGNTARQRLLQSARIRK